MSEGDSGSVGVGIGMALVGHIVCQGIAFVVLLQFTGDQHLGELNALVPLFGIGLSQVLYLGPLALVLRARERKETAKGVWIAMAVTFLLNGACFGLMMFPI